MSVIAPKLLCWFRFDGSYSDASGLKITWDDATSLYPPFSPGRTGLAATFDGNDDYLYLTTAQFDPYVTKGGGGNALGVTYCFWVKPTGDSANQGYGANLFTIAGATLYVGFRGQTGTYDFNFRGTHVSVFCNFTQWFHVAVVADGTNVDHYINGELAYRLSETYTLLFDTGIGLGYTNGDYAYRGQMSDFMMFGKALSKSDLKLIISGGIPS